MWLCGVVKILCALNVCNIILQLANENKGKINRLLILIIFATYPHLALIIKFLVHHHRHSINNHMMQLVE